MEFDRGFTFCEKVLEGGGAKAVWTVGAFIRLVIFCIFTTGVP